jgi:hypothetical protein
VDWAFGQVFLPVLRLPRQYHHKCATLFFYMLLLPKERAKTGNRLKKQCCFGSGRALTRKVLSLKSLLIVFSRKASDTVQFKAEHGPHPPPHFRFSYVGLTQVALPGRKQFERPRSTNSGSSTTQPSNQISPHPHLHSFQRGHTGTATCSTSP